MAIRRTIPVHDGIFFITLTCRCWENLFQIANAYHAVYDWFDCLKELGHYIVGYVIMPNHLHSLIAFRNTQGQTINKIVGNGKRFMAYEIVSQLEQLGEDKLLTRMASNVTALDRRRKKLHEVFEPSFDWKECRTEKFIGQKLDYIHTNPCRGKWNLVEQYWDYPHSSAYFYVAGDQGVYAVMSYGELRDIDLTKSTID